MHFSFLYVSVNLGPATRGFTKTRSKLPAVKIKHKLFLTFPAFLLSAVYTNYCTYFYRIILLMRECEYLTGGKGLTNSRSIEMIKYTVVG